MDDQPGIAPSLPGPPEVYKSMVSIAERSQRLVVDFVSRQVSSGQIPENDPLNVGEAFLELSRCVMANPTQVLEQSFNLWGDYVTLWETTTRRMLGADVEPVINPKKSDYRFRDDTWTDNQVSDFVKQSYLLTSRWLQSSINAVEGMDKRSADKVDFYTRQFIDAI